MGSLCQSYGVLAAAVTHLLINEFLIMLKLLRYLCEKGLYEQLTGLQYLIRN